LNFGADESRIMTLHRGIDMDAFLGESLEHDETENRGEDAESGDQISELSAIAVSNAKITKSQNHQIAKFLSTRSLAPEYMIDKLLDAFKIVVEKIPGAKLEIAGDGTEVSALKQHVDELEIGDNVTFFGRLDKTKMIDLLYSSNIYISIIQTEGISSSLIEGIACGLLPIISDMPASRQLIDDKINGYLIKDITPDALAAIMIKAADSLANMQTALQANRKNILEKFDRKHNQKAFVDKYRELLKSCNSKRINF